MRMLPFILLFSLWAATVSAAVNLNTATREELQSLKGIGPARAQAIVDYRTQHGPFLRVEDLARVRGIGEKTVRRLEKSLTLTGPTVIDSGPEAETPKRAR